MSKLFRYFISIIAHVAWQRSGKAGPLPHFKAPGRKTTRLPVPSAWQIMVATWIFEKLWQAFGDDVKHKLTHTNSPAVNRLGKMIPAPGDAASSSQASPQAGTVTPTIQPVNQQSAQKPAAKTDYSTRKLNNDPLPPGSVLGSLRSS